MKAKASEKGQALILIVFAIIGLIGLTALAVDGGNAYSERRRAQNTADASVLAAALAKTRGQDLSSAGLTRAANNGYNNDGTTNTVVVNSPPTSGPYAGNNEYIQVVITASVNTYFGPVIGVNTITNTVEAVARAKPSVTSPMVFGNAIVSLAQSGNKTFWTHGNPNMTTQGGGIFVNSSTDCGFTSDGVPNLTTPSISIVGAISCPQMAGAVTYNVGQMAYPPMVLPNPTCTGNAVQTGDVLSPGRVAGDFPPKDHGVQVTNLESGIYCIEGDFSLNGNDTLTGSGVVIVMESGSVTLNGSGTLDLSAPTSGPFQGLLIYLPMSNDSVIKINGTNDQRLTGSILAPASLVKLDGTADTNAFHTQIVGYEVDIAGTFDGIIRYNDSENFDASTQPDVELIQ
jgi:Flp pilus assembly protein TadG